MESYEKAYEGFEKLYICNVSDWLTNRAKMSPFFKGYPVETVFNGLDTTVFGIYPIVRLLPQNR